MKATVSINDADLRAIDAKLSGFRRLSKEGAKIALGHSAGRVGVSLAKLTHPRTYEQGRNRIAKEMEIVYPKSKTLVERAKRSKAWIDGPLWKAIFAKQWKEVESLFRVAGQNVKTASRATKDRHSRARVHPNSGGGTRAALVKPLADDILLTGSRESVPELAERIAQKQTGNAAASWLVASGHFRRPRSSDDVPRYKANKRNRPNNGRGTWEGPPNDLRAVLAVTPRYMRRVYDPNTVNLAMDFEREKLFLQMRTLIRKGYVTPADTADLVGI